MLSYEKLGELMGRDPEQLMNWLSGRIRPCKGNIQKIERFLSANRFRATEFRFRSNLSFLSYLSVPVFFSSVT